MWVAMFSVACRWPYNTITTSTRKAQSTESLDDVGIACTKYKVRTEEISVSDWLIVSVI